MRTKRWWDKDVVKMLGLIFFVILLGLSMLFVSQTALVKMDVIINIILVGALVIITSFYAFKTREIAEATKSLATESVEQGYSGFLPIIDILEKSGGRDLISRGLDAEEGQYPNYISCSLSNIGKGPAFGLVYQAVHSGDQVISLSEPTLLVGETMDSVLGPGAKSGISKGSQLALKVEQDDDGLHSIRVQYQDAFGRKFISSKEVQLEDKGCSLGHIRFDRNVLEL